MLSGMARWGAWTGGEKIIPDGCRFASRGETYWVEPLTNLLQKNKNVRITESQWVVMSVTFKTQKKTNNQRAASDPYHDAFQLHCSRHSDSKSRKLTGHTKGPRRQHDAGA